MVKKLLLVLLLFCIVWNAGCGGGKSDSSIYTGITGTIYFSGEPSSTLPDPGVLSLNTKVMSIIPQSFKQTVVSEPDSLIVYLSDNLTMDEQQKALKNLNFKVIRQLYSNKNAYVISHVSKNIYEAYNLARQSSIIRKVEYNDKMVKFDTTPPNDPNDPNYSIQWDLKLTKFNVAWDTHKGGSTPVVIAVLDTGLNVDSIEIKDRLVDSSLWKDFVGKDNDPRDTGYHAGPPENRYSHGTHVTGIIASQPNNNFGYSGCLWYDSVETTYKIMPIRVLGDDGNGSSADIIDGIYWAVDHGAKIINLSLGVDDPYTTVLDSAFTYALNNGVTLVCAAGNSNLSTVAYPARLAGSFPNVIAVGATGYTNQRASYSNYGSALTVVAPGGDPSVGTKNQQAIWNIMFDKLYDTEILDGGMIGTSQATPHVTALAAMLYSYGVTNPGDIKTIISQSATDLGADGRINEYGYGLINAFAAFIRKDYPVNITDVIVGVRDPVTKVDVQPPVNPDSSGVYRLPNVKNGSWELYAYYPISSNGYRYSRVISITVNGPMTRNFSLHLLPE